MAVIIIAMEIIIKTPVTITKDPGYDYKMLVTH